MSCFAAGSRTRLAYVAEATYGTTPPTPAMEVLPFISEGLNLTKEVFEDPSIQSDRQRRFHRHGNQSVEGELSVAYAHETYDDLLAALLWGTWTANVLKIGETEQSFTMEVGHTDIDQYRVFTGVAVDTFTLEVNLDGVVSANFGLMGKSHSVSGTELDASPTAAPDKQPFTHLSGTFKEGGTAIATLTGITLTIENNLQRNFVLGSNTAVCLSPGTYNITGEATAYFNDAALLTKFINETSTSIEFTLTDGTNTHTWKLSSVKFDGASINVDTDQTLPITIPFYATYNSGDASSVMITRSA